MDFSPLIISIKTSLLATALAFVFGILAARAVLKIRRFRGLIDGLFTLPMVLPPTVVGFFLILIFGKNSPIGALLFTLNLSVIFTWGATVISASVVSFPLMYRTALGAFEQLDRNLIYAARTLGMTEWKIFRTVILPNCWPGIAAGTVLAFARALGEFGATAMIAGNIPGKTQTISMAIYSAVQAGDRSAAYLWSAVAVVISFAGMILLNFWSKHSSGMFPANAG